MRTHLAKKIVITISVLFWLWGLASSEAKDPQPRLKRPQTIPNTIELDGWSNPKGSNANAWVKVWVGYVSGSTRIGTPGYSITFTNLSGPGPIPQTGVSDANGELKRSMGWNTRTYATTYWGNNNMHNSSQYTSPSNPRIPNPN